MSCFSAFALCFVATMISTVANSQTLNEGLDAGLRGMAGVDGRGDFHVNISQSGSEITIRYDFIRDASCTGTLKEARPEEGGKILYRESIKEEKNGGGSICGDFNIVRLIPYDTAQWKFEWGKDQNSIRYRGYLAMQGVDWEKVGRAEDTKKKVEAEKAMQSLPFGAKNISDLNTATEEFVQRMLDIVNEKRGNAPTYQVRRCGYDQTKPNHYVHCFIYPHNLSDVRDPNFPYVGFEADTRSWMISVRGMSASIWKSITQDNVVEDEESIMILNIKEMIQLSLHMTHIFVVAQGGESGRTQDLWGTIVDEFSILMSSVQKNIKSDSSRSFMFEGGTTVELLYFASSGRGYGNIVTRVFPPNVPAKWN